MPGVSRAAGFDISVAEISARLPAVEPWKVDLHDVTERSVVFSLVKATAKEKGETVELVGVLRAVPETANEALRRFGLTQEQFKLVRDEQVFIRANRAEVVGGG